MPASTFTVRIKYYGTTGRWVVVGARPTFRGALRVANRVPAGVVWAIFEGSFKVLDSREYSGSFGRTVHFRRARS